MKIATFETLGSYSESLESFCNRDDVIVHQYKAFFDPKLVLFNVVVYYTEDEDSVPTKTKLQFFNMDTYSEKNALEYVLNSERASILHREEFCGRGGGPILVFVVWGEPNDRENYSLNEEGGGLY